MILERRGGRYPDAQISKFHSPEAKYASRGLPRAGEGRKEGPWLTRTQTGSIYCGEAGITVSVWAAAARNGYRAGGLPVSTRLTMNWLKIKQVRMIVDKGVPMRTRARK